MKVEFYLGIGYPGADHREVVNIPDDYTDKDITQCLEDWAGNYLDMGYIVLED